MLKKVQQKQNQKQLIEMENKLVKVKVKGEGGVEGEV